MQDSGPRWLPQLEEKRGTTRQRYARLFVAQAASSILTVSQSLNSAGRIALASTANLVEEHVHARWSIQHGDRAHPLTETRRSTEPGFLSASVSESLPPSKPSTCALHEACRRRKTSRAVGRSSCSFMAHRDYQTVLWHTGIIKQFYGTPRLSNSFMAHWDCQTVLWHTGIIKRFYGTLGLPNSLMAHWEYQTCILPCVTVESRNVEPGYVEASCRWRAGGPWPYLERAASAMRIAAYVGWMTFAQCGTKLSNESDGCPGP